MTAASNARASGFLKHGVFMPAAKNAKDGSYVKGASKGLLDIAKKLEPDNEVSAFLDFGLATRMRKILDDAKSFELTKLKGRLVKAKLKPKKNATQIKSLNTQLEKVKLGLVKTEVPFNTLRINKSIDFGKLTPGQFYTKYKSDFPNVTKEQYIKSKDSRKNNFVLVQSDLKRYTDELLKYSQVSEMVGLKEVEKILAANPEVFIPFTRGKPGKTLWQRLTKTNLLIQLQQKLQHLKVLLKIYLEKI
tara:strand:- start:441 stop:1181 length:741 start_codon:yes stop_codon:yes gene_type:complete